MKSVEIPESAIVPLDSIAPDIVGLRVLFVNLFTVSRQSGWTLVDTALYGSAGRTQRWAREHFGDTPPDAIILAHAHFDHVERSTRCSASGMYRFMHTAMNFHTRPEGEPIRRPIRRSEAA
jgi:glyoxylase-like metal-dependent hydrolase (beta-lactamase superfamily II)